MLLKGYNDVKNSFNQNIALEMLFIKLCYSNQLPPIDSLISDLKATVQKDSKKIQSITSEQTEDLTESVNIPRTVCRYMLDWLSLLIMRSVDVSWNEFLASPGRSETLLANL